MPSFLCAEATTLEMQHVLTHEFCSQIWGADNCIAVFGVLLCVVWLVDVDTMNSIVNFISFDDTSSGNRGVL